MGELPSTGRLADMRYLVFVSFSHADEQYARLAYQALSAAGLAVWMDHHIAPGTPDWERSIRNAMGICVACVVLASPNSQASQYVRAELALARSQNVPIYPVWIHGDQWAESIALDLLHTQYIDVRPCSDPRRLDSMAADIVRLSAQSLPAFQIVAKCGPHEAPVGEHAPLDSLPPGCVAIALTEARSGPAAIVRTDKFVAIGELLNLLYSEALSDRFQPYAYGPGWVLRRMTRKGPRPSPQVLAPFEWLTGIESSSGFHSWARLSCEAVGLQSNTYWQVGTEPTGEYVGFAFKTKSLAYWFENAKIAYSLIDQQLFEPLPPPYPYDPSWSYRVVRDPGFSPEITASRVVAEKGDLDRAYYDRYQEEFEWYERQRRYPQLPR